MRLRSLFTLLMILQCGSLRLQAQNPLLETRSTLEKWVETRQLISKTRADWQSDRETLEQTAALYERELAGIAEQMSKVITNNTQVTREMAEATALQEGSREALSAARRVAADLETRIKSMAPRFPAPLQDIIEPLIVRMPSDPADTRMLSAERMQVLVGVLNEVDKFNNAVNLFNEKRQNAKGEEVAVQTVYIGLGAAYFVNEAGDFAGVGTPGTAGWEWSPRPEIAGTVQEVVRIYRNERTARFVTLPATLH
jgi:hypothetical protein